MFDPRKDGPPQIPSQCATCGKDAPDGSIVLLNGEFYRLHYGECTAKFYLSNPELMKRNDMTPEFLEEFTTRQQ